MTLTTVAALGAFTCSFFTAVAVVDIYKMLKAHIKSVRAGAAVFMDTLNATPVQVDDLAEGIADYLNGRTVTRRKPDNLDSGA